MAATIKDVAELAKVSTATVSHVLNGTRFVSDEMKIKVNEAVRQLGYIPNVNASGLRNSKTKRIGLVVPAIGSFFSVDIMESVEQVLKVKGYQIIIGCTHEELETEKQQVELFNYQQIDGMIMFPAPGDHSYLERMQRDYPIVFIDRAALNCRRDLFLGDNEQATYDVTARMLKSGHRCIGIINGLPGISSLDERICGYKRALREHGVEVDESLIRAGNSTSCGGYEETKWLVENTGMTALISLTNTMTLGVMKYLTQAKIDVPGRVAVVAFGESEWAEITRPPLTTLRHPLFEMGRCAAERLLERIERADDKGEKLPYETVRMPIELIRRGSF